jgi:hypothetical protein
MNSSKKLTVAGIVVVVILVVICIIWLSARHSSTASPAVSFLSSGASAPTSMASGTIPVAVSETTKVSGSLSSYENAELGFSVKYNSAWEEEETNSGVNFIIPIDKSQVSTVATLQAIIQVLSGTCAFPPVTTIKDRGTIKVGNDPLNMISMSNTVQGRGYFNRMYSLQHGNICYMFSFASITQASSSKGLTGSDATQAENNNKAMVNTADGDFTDMVKSFAYATTPQGTDESKVASATSTGQSAK